MILNKLLLAALLLPTSFFGINVYQTETGNEVVVPGMRVYVTGLEWVTERVASSSFFLPADSLAGYTVRLDGQLCPIEQITPERLHIQVPPTVRASTDQENRLLEISGPKGYLSQWIPVTIADPRLRKTPGDDPECCANGMYSVSGGPNFFGVNPLNVGETGAFVAINGIGMLAARDMTPAPEVIIWRQGYRQTFPAQIFPFAGFFGNDQVFFRAPACLNGDYHVQVRVAGILSPRLTIKFVSSCSIGAPARTNCGTSDQPSENSGERPVVILRNRCNFWLKD